MGVVGLASGLPASLAVAAGWSAGALVLPPVVVVLLVAATTVLDRALRPLLLVLAATVSGLWLGTVALTLTDPIITAAPVAVRILAVNGAKVVPLALTVAIVLRYRPHPDTSGLRVGNWSADSGLRIAGHSVDWRWIGPAVALVLCGAIVATAAGDLSGAGLAAALVWLPVYTAAALVNSAAEEFMFRHAINAVARPLVRRPTLIALTSLYFGVVHINGNPSGPAGILLAGAFGVVLALAIEHTRGFCWNWTLHFLADMAIFFTLIATSPV